MVLVLSMTQASTSLREPFRNETPHPRKARTLRSALHRAHSAPVAAGAALGGGWRLGGNVDGSTLAGIDLLRGLAAKQLDHVAARCQFRAVEKGRTVIEASEASTDIYFVVDGRLVARGRTAQGKEIRYLTLEGGDTFGEFSAIDGQPRSAAIVAVTDALVARMDRARMRELMLLVPQFALAMCEMLVAKNRDMSARIDEFVTLDVRSRIHLALLRLTKRHDGALTLPPTQYEIAIEAGTHRETVSREMAKLARDGVIAYDRTRLDIHRPEKLRESLM